MNLEFQWGNILESNNIKDTGTECKNDGRCSQLMILFSGRL